MRRTELNRSVGGRYLPNFGRPRPQSRHRPGELPTNPPATVWPLYSVGGCRMRFEIVAEKESETVRMKRDSSLIAIAKARVWASEGWDVTIVVDESAPASAEEFSLSLA